MESDYVFVSERVDSLTGSFVLENLPPVAFEIQERDIPKDCWVACKEPERPFDQFHTALHDCCPACLVYVQATDAQRRIPLTTDEGTIADIMVARLNEHGSAPGAITWRGVGG